MAIGLIAGALWLFTDFFYWIKYAATLIALYLWRRSHPKRLDVYDTEAKDEAEKLGILVPKEEIRLESPFPEEHLWKAADEIFLYGVNSKSESLIIRIARAPNDEAEAWIYLKLADGRWFELEEKAGYQRNYGGKCTSFSCGGLQMHYLIPMRRWRIVFCGMLREGIKKGENKETKEVFVKFTFLWKATSDVFDQSTDFNNKTTAKGMARAKWSSPIPPVETIPELLNFYYQSGTISGLVSIEDEPEITFYLYGEKLRFLAECSYSIGCKFKHIMGVTPESGLVFHLGKASAPNTFHNLYLGYIVHPDSFNRVIEDGLIISRRSGSAVTGEDLTATFKAGRSYELKGNFVGDGVHFTSEQGWNGHMELVGIEFEIDGLKGSGFMLTGEIHSVPERKFRKLPPSMPNVRPLTVFFSDDTSHLTELSGGKGSSLGMLTKLSSEMKSEFIVPRGIVVTTAAYEEFLTVDLIKKVDKLKDITYGNIQGNIQEACKEITSAVERIPLPDKIRIEIAEKLRTLFGVGVNERRFAVRSSATGEDTDQMSAAGQMDTFLGVQGMQEIFNAVKKCWASQFAYIATEYKRQNGQVLNSPMAVVIQEMVECEAAGVLFTCDPVTNNPSVAVITGNYGLGESVVSGSEEPDTVVLKKLPENEVEIKSVSVGMKQHRIVMKGSKSSEVNDTVVTEDVPDDQRSKCCISEEMAKKLGKLSLKIEDYYRSPRDIEWGIKDGSIYILQSRPVTTGAAPSDYEIKHELDGALRCEGDYYTVANMGEVFPGATSPLGIDVILRYFSSAIQQKRMRERMKNSWLQHKFFSTGFFSHLNHMTITVLDMLTRAGDVDSVDAQGMMISMFGRILDDPELRVMARHREAIKDKVDLTLYYTIVKNSFFAGYGMEKLKDRIFNYQILAENGRNSVEIFDRLMQSCSHLSDPLIGHVTCIENSSLWNMIMLGTLSKVKGGIDADVYGDFAKLLATVSNVESADIPSGLQRLAQAIVKEMKSEDFKSMTLEDAQEWLETSKGVAGYKFRQFIKRHGHRCLKEFDIRSFPWNADSKPLVKLLQNMVGKCEDAKDKKEEDISTLFPKLTTPLDFKTKLLLRFLLPNCRRGVREREAAKNILVKSVDNVRRGFRHLSKTMVAEGYIPDADLLFFLNLDEINDLLQTRNPKHISRANHRRKIYPILDGYILPEVFRGLPTPINENQDEEIEYKADLTMKGIPVSQGSIKAYARVALSLEEAAHLKKGEILITYATDIGWSPYFPILAGVVTELGGLISHGAVVSREYGLPCVVGLHGATKQFKTGDYVLLDGNKGILQRLTPPDQ